MVEVAVFADHMGTLLLGLAAVLALAWWFYRMWDDWWGGV